MKRRNILKGVLPPLVLWLGIGAIVYFVRTKPQPGREEVPEPRALVEVLEARRAPGTVALTAQGQVVPAREVVLQPEVSGRVVWVADALVPGGVFRKGERMLRINPRDYQLALKTRNAEVSRAELELELERSHGAIAEREWQSLHRGEGEEGRSLALREPHLRTAEVGLEAAKSSLEQARLALRRTTLTAPFNCTVREESVDVGQVVGAQMQIARLIGTDAYWAQVSVPVDALTNIALPAEDRPGASVTIRQSLREGTIERKGSVLRVLPAVDPAGAMARVLVSIEDPLGLADGEPDPLPLLVGSYVNVEIDAPPIEGVVEVPRAALHEGNRVYVMNGEDRLEIRDVRVAWSRRDTVLVDDGVEDGERIVTSFLPTPVHGMALRTETKRQSSSALPARTVEPAPEPAQ